MEAAEVHRSNLLVFWSRVPDLHCCHSWLKAVIHFFPSSERQVGTKRYIYISGYIYIQYEQNIDNTKSSNARPLKPKCIPPQKKWEWLAVVLTANGAEFGQSLPRSRNCWSSCFSWHNSSLVSGCLQGGPVAGYICLLVWVPIELTRIINPFQNRKLKIFFDLC